MLLTIMMASAIMQYLLQANYIWYIYLCYEISEKAEAN